MRNLCAIGLVISEKHAGNTDVRRNVALGLEILSTKDTDAMSNVENY